MVGVLFAGALLAEEDALLLAVALEGVAEAGALALVLAEATFGAAALDGAALGALAAVTWAD